MHYRRALGAFLLSIVITLQTAAASAPPDPAPEPDGLHIEVGRFLHQLEGLPAWLDGIERARQEEAARVAAALEAQRQEVERQRVAAAEAAAAAAADRPQVAQVEQPVRSDCSFAIPCDIVMAESGGDYGAANPSSSACGAYQILDSTWDGYGGYSSACDAPPAVQDAKAAELWAGGAGCTHWTQTSSEC